MATEHPAKSEKIAKEIRQVKLSNSDKLLFSKYEVIAEAIAREFGSGCEVVLHSLENMAESVIKIYNGHVTGRSVGSPITDLALKILEQSINSDSNIVGPYYSYTANGKPLKSVTVLIRNDRNKPIGFLCINFDLSMPFIDILKTFINSNGTSQEAGEHFVTDVAELVRSALKEEWENVMRIEGLSRSERHRTLILGLDRRGVFGIKGAVEHAAKELGVTKFTIYKYLREIRRAEP